MKQNPWDRDHWENFLRSTTLSSSGWRRIFNLQNDPQSLNPKLTQEQSIFIVTAAEVIVEYFKKNKDNSSHPSLILAIGRDSRPSGKAITSILIKTLNTHAISFYNLGVTALPQCSTWVKAHSELIGFIFVTASHNPPGYNGIKIGGHHGQVISSQTNKKLVLRLKKKLEAGRKLKTNSKNSSPHLSLSSSSQDYRISLLKSMGYRKKNIQKHLEAMIQSLSRKSYAIGCDFNGSARIQSIDKSLIEELGIQFLSIHDRLGYYAHDIVPEQKSLDFMKRQMSSRSWKNFSLLFGYVVDCDGDRGNIVVNDHRSGKVIPFAPDAQTTFALTVLSELCFLEAFYPQRLTRTYIVANDPTSLRIDHLVKKFGVQLARAEVGEANVVNLAQKLRRGGYLTPIMGEGSNGGSILFPAVTRDPLIMAISLVKLLFMTNNTNSLRAIAINKLGLPQSLKQVPPQFFLGKIIPHINTHYSTPVFDPSALMSISYSSQKNFKMIYEERWTNLWRQKKKLFQSWGITDYQILNYEGINVYKGAGNRHGNEDGGHKISFFSKKTETGFIWFRFSKTEPVLRLSAEHANASVQKKLFKIQNQLLLNTAAKDRG